MNLDMVMANEVKKELAKIKHRVAQVEKKLRDPEGELSPWAKRELAKARRQPESSYISTDEMARRLERQRSKIR